MKTLVVIVVLALHLLVIYLLVGPASEPDPARGGSEADPEPTAAEGSQTATDAPPPPADNPALPRFRRADFRDMSRPLPASVQARTGDCKTGVLLDWTHRTILWRKRETRPAAIASLSKMMTALLLMEAVSARDDVSLRTKVRVTKSAAGVGGSQVYLDPRETFTLGELLKCVMIFSANDAAQLVAEYCGGGDSDRFVRGMNGRAAELDLSSLKFHNAHGLPTPGQSEENQGCAIELAYLAGMLLRYPDVVGWSSTWLSYIREDTDKPFQLVNRNRLVNLKHREGVAGVNGMKTGYTRRAGYCVAATCEREKRVLIVVVSGCRTATERNRLVGALLEWAYAQPST